MPVQHHGWVRPVPGDPVTCGVCLPCVSPLSWHPVFYGGPELFPATRFCSTRTLARAPQREPSAFTSTVTPLNPF